MDFHGAIDNMQKENAGSSHPEAGDYKKDGLLYCGHCDTPRQRKVNLLGKDYIFYKDCECRALERQLDEAEKKRREFKKIIQNRRNECFPDSKMQTWTFENDDGSNAKYTAAMQRYVLNFEKFLKEGRGTILHGPVGTGKTYLAASTANALIDAGYPVIFTSLSRVASTLQSTWEKQEYIDHLASVPLVIIDDFGTERDTAYMKEIIFAVVNARYNAGLPLIVTTNKTMAEMINPEDLEEQRIYSRLLEICYPIEVTGRDKRRDKMKETYKPMRDILGV